MSIVPVLLQHRAQLAHLFEVIEAQRGRFWTDGKFSLATLQQAQSITAALPNLRTESLLALSAFGDVVQLPAADESLDLSGIGWLSARVDQLSEVARIEAVEQAIARLGQIKDATLLASATAIAKTLRDDRDEWTAKLAPIAKWAAKHKAEIDEESTV